MPPFDRFSRRALLVLVAVLVVSAVVPTAAADQHDGLPIGDWVAHGEASGVATAVIDGLAVEWTGTVPADFEFSVTGPQGVEGTWTHDGGATYVIEGNTAQGPVRLEGDVGFRGGGEIGGTNLELLLDGQTTNTGQAVITAAGRTRTVAVDNSSPIPQLRLRVHAVTCNEAYGEWAYALEQAFEEGRAFTASIDGTWTGFRQTEEIQAEAEKLLAAAAGQTEIPETDSPLLDAAASLLKRYNDFADAFPGWSASEVVALLAETEHLLVLLRNLTPCDLELFGEQNVETFVNGLTLVVQQLILGTLADFDVVDSEGWQYLVNVAIRTGAIGAGVANPESAEDAEEALIAHAERILEDNVDPSDGRILVNDDTKRVMATAAVMGWELDVGGDTYDARKTYQESLGDDWRDAAPGGDDG